MTSLRYTALIWMTALLTVVGVLAFFVSYELARREAADFLDGQLRQIALNAGAGLADAKAPGAKHDPEDEFVITIWNPAGEALRHSPNDIDLPQRPEPGYATIQANGEDWRVYLARDDRRSVQVAQRMSVRQEMAEAASIQAGAPILILIPLTWLVIGWALGQLLRRLTDVAGEIAERGIDSREQIPVARVPAEIRQIVDAMNVLINRLQQALEQQRRFVADAAHELRTPLAALHIQIDNLRANARNDQSSLISELHAGVSRATALVEQLLRLARSENSTGQTQREIVDLSELVTQCVADLIPLADAKGIDLGIAAHDIVLVQGWPADLKMLFGNLVDNAIRYTPAGGTVDVTVRRNSASVSVEILDTGCGVAEPDLPRLFDRFFRASPVDVEGSGLGLSIAFVVAQRHGLTIQIENRIHHAGLRVLVLASPEDDSPIHP